MKKQSNVMYILRISFALLLITSVVAALLGGVNAITEPVIAKADAEKTQAAISAVLPGGGEPVDYADTTGLVTEVYGSDAGYAVQVALSGFDGEINMMIGVDKDGKVLGISIISHTETAGLGAVAAANNTKGEDFRNQFIGMDGSVSVAKDGGEVDALTGATITSRAVCEGINVALACVEKLG